MPSPPRQPRSLLSLRDLEDRGLTRMAVSRTGTFVLKGATLFSVWTGPHRTTKDVDLLGLLSETTPELDELDAWIARERVRVVVLGEGPTGDADLARAHPERFRELFRSQYPEWQPCAVFEVLGR